MEQQPVQQPPMEQQQPVQQPSMEQEPVQPTAPEQGSVQSPASEQSTTNQSSEESVAVNQSLMEENNQSQFDQEFHIRNSSDSDEREMVIDTGEDTDDDDDEVQETEETENKAPQKGEVDEIFKVLRESCKSPPTMDRIDFNFIMKDLGTIEKIIESDSLTDRVLRSKIHFDVYNRKFPQYNPNL